jgi:REP element-mobilizing transposase RayT
VQLNGDGEVVATCWRAIPHHFPHTVLDDWIVMPNHLHGIVIRPGSPATPGSVGATHASPSTLPPGITRPLATEVTQRSLPRARPAGPKSQSLGAIVGSFKSAVTKRLNAGGQALGPTWQRNFFEHVIRDDETLNRIRQYIANNPSCWDDDEENPLATRRVPVLP